MKFLAKTDIRLTAESFIPAGNTFEATEAEAQSLLDNGAAVIYVDAEEGQVASPAPPPLSLPPEEP